ncbi:PadR family transcriptional regulator [Paenibacillaceae bacterium]|nr:PadR family transcriptional regulator [Paenibacillaceae bacterium]
MSEVECVVLGLLHEEYQYGYELDKAIDERNMRYWNNLSKKSIYLALQRMQGKGWVQASECRQPNFPAQIRYTLTSEGKAAFIDMVSSGLGSQELIKLAYSVPVAFLSVLPVEESMNQMLKRRDWLAAFVADIPDRSLDEDHSEPLGKRANIRLLRAHYEMELEWLDWLLSQLKKDKFDEEKGNLNG